MIATEMKVCPLQDGSMHISLTIPDNTNGNHLAMLSANCDKFEVEIKKWRPKRSLRANNYIWVIMDKIAKALHSTKIEIYHEAIRQVGLFKDYEIASDAVRAIGRWHMDKGEGWLVEVSSVEPREGFKTVRFYRGSSDYNSEEMSRLIDYVVEEANELGIETLTPDELAKLKAQIGE